MNKKYTYSQRGFTIIEILAVTILMAGLFGMAAVGINGAIKKSRINTAKAQIGSLEQGVTSFNMTCGFDPDSIEDLVQSPTGSKCKDYPEEGFLSKKSIPLDPWKREYSYQKPGTHNTSGVDLWSSGPDGEDGTADDVVNWESESDGATE